MRQNSHGQDKLPLLEKPAFFLRSYKLRKFLNDCDVLVDMGCGFKAPLIRWLLKNLKIKKAIGLDLSFDESLRSDSLDLVRVDLNNRIPVKNDVADYITSLAVLEHLDHPEINLGEVFRILRPGGLLVLTTPTPRAKPILEFLSFKLGLIEKQEITDHKTYFGKDLLRKSLLAAGFLPENVKIETFFFGLNNFVIAKK
jgi:SAM-dependent methyltransferase